MREELNSAIPSGIARIAYKEIVGGDLRKFEAKSNDANTGGGARDLRFNPYKEFINPFSRMLPTKTEEYCEGSFHFYEDNMEQIRTARFFSPTKARKNEGRIGNVDKCIPKLSSNFKGCGKLFLMIIQREDGEVWVHFVTEKSLLADNWHPTVKDEILLGSNAKRKVNVSACGYIDFEKGERFYNGE